VDVIWHRVPFQQLDVLLSAQLPQNLPNLAVCGKYGWREQ
jgi:hypothetical protein